MPAPITFRVLSCPGCAQPGLMRLVQVHYKPGGGLVDEPGGYWCPRCQRPIEAADMMRAQRVADKQQELQQLLAEMGDEAPPVEAERGRMD